MHFPEDWISYDPAIDLFVLKEAADRTPIGHPISATIQPVTPTMGSFLPAASEPDWRDLIESLASWRTRRFHLAQAETLSLAEIKTIQDAIHNAGGHLVLSLGESSAAPNMELPAASRIHIPISHNSSPERFDLLGSLTAAGHSVRALTLLDPNDRELLPELGSELAIRDVREWTISPPFGSADTHWLFDPSATEPPFITYLKKQFSWMSIEHACFPIREGNLIVQSQGAIFTTDPVTAKRIFLGWLTRTSLANLLANGAFNQTFHLASWLHSPSESARIVPLLPEPLAQESDPFQAFVSYNNDDWPEVKELAIRLQQAGIRLWVDKWEIQPGTRWLPECDEIINKIPVMLVLIGKAGNLASPNQKLECDAFQQKSEGRRLIPVILDSAPVNVDLPSSLNTYSRVDLRQRDPDPFDQLLWGITGRKPPL